MSVFGIAVRVLLRATSLPHCMVSFPAPGQGLSVSAFKGCSSALKVFLFRSAGSSHSTKLLRYQRNFLWSGGPVQLVTLRGLSLWFFRTCLGLRGAPLDIQGALFCFGMRASSLLCLGWAPWVIPCYVFSWSGGVVSFAFVTSFVAKTQAPPLLLGLRASLYRPNQRETIAMGDCYILCGLSGVTWSASAAHRQRCKRFHFCRRV